LLNSLEKRGYVTRPDRRGRYVFTPKLFDLANTSLIGLGIRQQVAPDLRALMERVGLTIHLVVRAQNEVVIIDKFSPQTSPQVATWVGKRLPFHCTGAGKALMAFQPEGEISRFLRQGLIRYNDNTIVSEVKLRAEFERIRREGVALDDEEENIGSRCLGAPLFEGQLAVAAFSVTGTPEQIHEDNLQSLTTLVRETSARLSTRLSHRGRFE
jgi:DNA-binding IclR family transcriptional regulator